MSSFQIIRPFSFYEWNFILFFVDLKQEKWFYIYKYINIKQGHSSL